MTTQSGSQSTLDQMAQVPLSIVNFGLSVMYIGASIALTPITLPLYVGKKIYDKYTENIPQSKDEVDEIDEINEANNGDDNLS